MHCSSFLIREFGVGNEIWVGGHPQLLCEVPDDLIVVARHALWKSILDEEIRDVVYKLVKKIKDTAPLIEAVFLKYAHYLSLLRGMRYYCEKAGEKAFPTIAQKQS